MVKTYMNVLGIFKCDFTGANTLSKHSPSVVLDSPSLAQVPVGMQAEGTLVQ